MLPVVVFVVGWRDKSANDNGVSGGEETSLLSLLFLASSNLLTVMRGVPLLFDGME
jgi:hypothetical protein